MKTLIEKLIFRSRWILVPFYLGLILAQAFYCLKFLVLLYEFGREFRHLDDLQTMLHVLKLVDMAMVANLIKMIISGSYQTFVNQIAADHLEKIGSGALKMKMGSSLIGISSIHLLSIFVEAKGGWTDELKVKLVIHLVFVVSTFALALIDFIHIYSKRYENEPHEAKIIHVPSIRGVPLTGRGMSSLPPE